jgi:hypothetical protein
MDYKLFSGIEVEGKFKGKKTLFVQEQVKYKDIKEAYDEIKPEQIYFGARFKTFNNTPSTFNWNSLLSSLGLDTIVTVETVSSMEYPYHPNLYFIVNIIYIHEIFTHVIKHKNYLQHIQYKFLQDDKVILIEAYKLMLASEEEYAQDELIEI